MEYDQFTICAAAAYDDESLTLDVLLKAKALIDAIPPDPLEQHMISVGADPRDGGVLILPESVQETLDFGPFGPPLHIKFSPWVDSPVIVPGIRSIPSLPYVD